MRAVGLRNLKDHLGEYVRLAASGETVLITRRGRVVAELVAPWQGRAEAPRDAFLADAAKQGWLTPAMGSPAGPLPRRPVATLAALLREMSADRSEPGSQGP
jgi:antitoxin (DNA-binding transcriptional repressor) of toxin-antitoxin stability system